ncbi:MAG: CRISPR-associated endonuclease Cas2 [Patescibacteria group bacterium]
MNKLSPTKTKTVLYQLANYIGQGLTVAMEMHRYQQIYLSGGGHEQVVEIKKINKQRAWRNNLYQLKRSGYIKTQKMGSRLIITLTSKELRLNLLQQIKKAPKCQAGFSTLVIFDIPEQTAKARRELRHFLQEVGFKQLQRSVWLHPCNIVKELQQFLNEKKLEGWVKVFRGEIVK